MHPFAALITCVASIANSYVKRLELVVKELIFV